MGHRRGVQVSLLPAGQQSCPQPLPSPRGQWVHRPRGCPAACWHCACHGMCPGHTVLLLPQCRASPGYWGVNVPFACGWGQQAGAAGSLAGWQLPGLHPARRAGSSAGHRFHGVFSSPAIIILLQAITAHNNNQAAAGCWFASSRAVAPSPAFPELGESLHSSPFCPLESTVCPAAAAPGGFGEVGSKPPPQHRSDELVILLLEGTDPCGLH